MLLYGLAILLAVTTSHVDALRRLNSGVPASRAIDRRADLPSCVPPECFGRDTYGLVPDLDASYHMNEHYFYFAEVDVRGQRMRLLLDTGSGSMWINDERSKPKIKCRQLVAGYYETGKSPFIYHRNDLRDGSSGQRPFYNTSYLDKTQVNGIRVSRSIKVYDQVRDQFDDRPLKGDDGRLYTKDNDRDIGNVTQTFGVAEVSGQCIGILGIGYPAADESEDMSLIRNLLSERLIESESYSLYPTRLTGGSILFGAVDVKKFHGNLTKLPMVQGGYKRTQPTVNISQLVTHRTGQPQSKKLFLTPDKPAVLDVGSVLTYLPPKNVEELIKSFEHDYSLDVQKRWDGQELYTVNCSWRGSSRYVNFTFSSLTIQIPSEKLILRTTINEQYDTCVFGVASTDHSRGEVILGYTFFRSVYAVFDLANEQVFLAPAKITAKGSDIREITAKGVASTLGLTTGSDTEASKPTSDDVEPDPNAEDSATPDEEQSSGDRTTTPDSSPTDPSSPVESDAPEQTPPNEAEPNPDESTATILGAWSGFLLWQIAGAIAMLMCRS